MKAQYQGEGKILPYPCLDCDTIDLTNTNQVMEKEVIKPCRGSCCPTIIVYKNEITVTDDYGGEATMPVGQWQELVNAWNKRQESPSK